MLCILFISLCIMFFSFPLDRWDGILTILIMVYSFHKMEIRGEMNMENFMSPVVNILNITCIHTIIVRGSPYGPTLRHSSIRFNTIIIRSNHPITTLRYSLCPWHLPNSFISRSSQIAELISEYVPGLMAGYPIGLQY